MTEAGFETVWTEVRQVKGALKAMPARTDCRDAEGIARLLQMGWLGAVHCEAASCGGVGVMRHGGRSADLVAGTVEDEGVVAARKGAPRHEVHGNDADGQAVAEPAADDPAAGEDVVRTQGPERAVGKRPERRPVEQVPRRSNELRLLFAPELGRPIAEALRSAAVLRSLMEAMRRTVREPAARGARPGKKGSRSGLRPEGLLWLALLLGLAGLAVTAIPPPDPASAQAIERGLFADTDSLTREVLAFLGGLGADNSSAVGDMLFAFNAGVLVLAGFLLVWHAAAGTVDTAREGRFGFGAWAIVRIVTAVALMAPLPGGLNGAQHAVVGLAHLGGDFANAVWKPFSEEALAESRPIVPRPREALWRAAISRTLIAETCARAANESAALAGDDPYVEIDEDEDDGTLWFHYDGDGRGMPDGMCGSIRFTGLEADGAPGLAAEGHRRALTGLLPAIRSIAGRLAAHYVPGTPLYGRPLPDIDALLAGEDLAGSYARVLDDALTQAASEERETLARVVAEDAREASWMAAASFFNTIAYRVGLFQAAAHNVPSVALPVPSLDEWTPAADAAVKGVAVQLARSRHYHPMLLSAANAGAGALPSSDGESGGMMSGLLEFIDLDSVIVADSGNPIADLAALGHGLLNAALAAVAALMGAATGSGLLESIPFIGKGLDVFESAWQVSDALVSTLLGLLVIAGAVLAYVLPALPFIRFLFGILGWILNVAVAVLAVTVFAAAHVTREDGDRLTVQATRQGWLFLPALILRPALMLLGLILGYFVFLAGIGLFNQVWLPQMRDAGASDGLGPVGFLAMLALYVIVAYGLMNASFKLIDLLPSAVLDWIGGRAGAGEDGGERTGGTAVAGMTRLGAVRVGARARRGGAGG